MFSQKQSKRVRFKGALKQIKLYATDLKLGIVSMAHLSILVELI